MLFGMTRGEIILVVFIFFLVYGAGFLPRLGEWVGGVLFGGGVGGGKPRSTPLPKDTGD